jgi:hypothetical protein
MGLFRRKKQNKHTETLPRPALIVLLESLPEIDEQATAKALTEIEPLRLAPTFELAKHKEWREGRCELGHVEFDSHRVRLVGFDTPLPDNVLRTTVDVIPLPEEDRESMRKHNAHIILWSVGGGKNTLERYLALYKLALALSGDQLRGVVVEEGCTATPPEVARSLMTPDMLKSIRETLPPVVFTGNLRMRDSKEGEWMVTKGHHVFGVPDFVMRVESMSPREMAELFHTILNYAVTTDKRIAAGHTMQLADELFMKLYKYEPEPPEDAFIAGDGETLEIKLVSPQEINKKD